MAYAPPRDPTNVMGRRIGAFLIDAVILGGISVALWASKVQHITGVPVDACEIIRSQETVSFCFGTNEDLYYVKGGDAGLIYGVGLGALFLLHVLLQGLTGGTIGKLLLGLRVVNGRGALCGFPRALVRWLFLLTVDGFCFVVGLVVVLVTHPHRRVGDFVAGTYVVGKSDVGRPPVPTYDAPSQYAPPAPGTWDPASAGAAGWRPPGTSPPPPAAPWDAPPPSPPPPGRGGWDEPPRDQ